MGNIEAAGFRGRRGTRDRPYWAYRSANSGGDVRLRPIAFPIFGPRTMNHRSRFNRYGRQSPFSRKLKHFPVLFSSSTPICRHLDSVFRSRKLCLRATGGVLASGLREAASRNRTGGDRPHDAFGTTRCQGRKARLVRCRLRIPGGCLLGLIGPIVLADHRAPRNWRRPRRVAKRTHRRLMPLQLRDCETVPVANPARRIVPRTGFPAGSAAPGCRLGKLGCGRKCPRQDKRGRSCDEDGCVCRAGLLLHMALRRRWRFSVAGKRRSDPRPCGLRAERSSRSSD